MKVHRLEFTHFPIMGLEFGTTMDRLSGKDTITVLRIKDLANTNMALRFKPDGGPTVNAGEMEEVELLFRGDAELAGLIGLMRLAIKVYEAQSRGRELIRDVGQFGHETFEYQGTSDEDAREVADRMLKADYYYFEE